METPAAARRAKRRKPEAPESPEQVGKASTSALPATSAPTPNPPRTGGDEPYIHHRPPGAAGEEEEEDGVDRISCLPDDILGEIISLLPSKDAARTRILATRWRHLWRSAPLNLDGGGLSIDVVSRILSAHLGPGRRFRFAARHLQIHPAVVDTWLRSPALDNLQEIDCFGTPWLELPPQPASAFRFSSSLCVATFSHCHFSDDAITQALQFPMLRKLALDGVSISEDSLRSFVAASPVLECLLLRGIFGFRCVGINSASLITIGVSAGYEYDVTGTMTCLEELIVEDAPCLRRILCLRSRLTGTRVSVISAPNLETLGCIKFDEYSSLVLGSMIVEQCNIRGLRFTNLTTSACTVKILAVNVFILRLDAVIELMRCFPCLEKLYIQSYQDGNKNLWRHKHRNLIKGLDIRLKTLVLNISYQGIKSQVSFATFFVLNAKMLESITFGCRSYGWSESFLAEQHQLLQLEKRASRSAQFYFTTKICEHVFMHINHAHDLSKSDPFQCEEKRGRCIRIL